MHFLYEYEFKRLFGKVICLLLLWGLSVIQNALLNSFGQKKNNISKNFGYLFFKWSKTC